VEQAHQIEQLTAHEGWAVYIDWLHHRLGPQQRRVLNGGFKSLEDYREAVGFIKGITVALTAQQETQQLVRTARDGN
jgi:hypothetical protein